MTCLFVPGFMADHTLWDDVIPALQLGEDTAFADLTRGATIDDMARQALDAAPAVFDLVGFSMGGYVARAMARLSPTRVRSLVLIATSSRADTPEQAKRKSIAAAQISALASFHGLSRTSILASLHEARASDAGMVERVRSMGMRLGKEAFVHQASLPRVSDAHLLSLIRCPTLVIAARDDRVRSLDEATELADGINAARLIVIDGSGHMLPIERPAALAQAMQAWWHGLREPGAQA